MHREFDTLVGISVGQGHVYFNQSQLHPDY